MNLHEARPLPKSNEPFWISEDSDDCTPMVFVADDAFPLTIHSMKTCGRVTTSFWLPSNVLSQSYWKCIWYLFSNRAALTPTKVEIIVMASLALHNLLRTKLKDSLASLIKILRVASQVGHGEIWQFQILFPWNLHHLQ